MYVRTAASGNNSHGMGDASLFGESSAFHAQSRGRADWLIVIGLLLLLCDECAARGCI